MAQDDDIINEIVNNLDRNLDDILEEADRREAKAASNSKQAEILEGLYKEVKVDDKKKKARRNVPKLDEARSVELSSPPYYENYADFSNLYRLRSPLGILKLQKIAKTEIKLRGKGHEVRRVTTMLHPKPQ
jgi:hypothetical protein